MSEGADLRTAAGRGWRYTVVGALCALSSYAVMLTVDALGGHYLLGMVFAFLIVTPLAFLLHSSFTFAEQFRWASFARFVVGASAAYPIATVVMIILCSGFGLSVAVATPIAMAVMFAYNYAMAHWSIVPSVWRFGARRDRDAADRR